MQRKYKTATITKNLNEKWVVQMPKHPTMIFATLAGAKDWVNMILLQE